MVHALREAARVLRPDGVLIDLRPAVEHCRVGILRAGRFAGLGVARGSLEGQRAAGRSVRQALALKILRQTRSARFRCDVVFSSPAALREWLVEFNESEGEEDAVRLSARAAAARQRGREGGRPAVRIALVMKVLEQGVRPRAPAEV